jgi:hypothetical protein
LHKIFTPSAIADQIGEACRAAKITCLECKRTAAGSISSELGPIQSRRSKFELNPNLVDQILKQGANSATEKAEETMLRVRKAMGIAGGLEFPPLTAFAQYSLETSQPFRLSLANHRAMWDAPAEERREFLIDVWRTKMVPSEYALKRSGDRLFITGKGKRVLVSTSREKQGGTFQYFVPNKSYEVIVLLAWEQTDFVLRQFLIPQKVYRTIWSEIPKGQPEIELCLRRTGDQHVLGLENASIDVSEFEANSAPLG